MKTITIQIGNSDNKLTQKEWNIFCETINGLLFYEKENINLQFSGGSPTNAPWQNFCWVFTCAKYRTIKTLCKNISEVGKSWNQDSIAWTEGETQFI